MNKLSWLPICDYTDIEDGIRKSISVDKIFSFNEEECTLRMKDGTIYQTDRYSLDLLKETLNYNKGEK